jgi:type II secretory pathway pseudopilin PulG
VQVQTQQQAQIQVLQTQQLQQQNMIQQQIQYSKEMCIQMQSYFERIARFMENVDKRLNNLEKVTNDMLKNTSHSSGNTNPPPSYPTSTQAEVPIETMFDRSELERLKKLQTQFDDDAAVARRLQEEYEREAKTSASKSSSSSKTTTSTTPKTTSEKYDTCPICQVQIVSSKLASHVNECLDGPTSYNDGKTPTPTPTDEKKGFWTSLFGKKEDGKTDTPTPTPTQPIYDLSQNPPQNSKGTFYPAPVMPTGTPGYPATPNGYPMVYPYQFPGNQPMYYYMPGPAQPQTQPKK